MGRLEGKIAFITGASRGIGVAIARLGAQRGYAVAVNFSRGENDPGTRCDDCST